MKPFFYRKWTREQRAKVKDTRPNQVTETFFVGDSERIDDAVNKRRPQGYLIKDVVSLGRDFISDQIKLNVVYVKEV